MCVCLAKMRYSTSLLRKICGEWYFLTDWGKATTDFTTNDFSTTDFSTNDFTTNNATKYVERSRNVLCSVICRKVVQNLLQQFRKLRFHALEARDGHGPDIGLFGVVALVVLVVCLGDVECFVRLDRHGNGFIVFA